MVNNAWDKWDECITCGDIFSPGATSPNCPMLSTCGHSICATCLWNLEKSANTDDETEEMNPDMPVRKWHCYLNCEERFFRTVHTKRELVGRKIKDAFQFDNPIFNHSFSQALKVLHKLRSNHDKGKDHSVKARIEKLKTKKDAFDKCPQCTLEYSPNLHSSTNRQVLHPQAPMVGFCGHTVCFSCLSDEHARELGRRQKHNLKFFNCPTCDDARAFKVDRLKDNHRFRDALTYWEAVKQGNAFQDSSSSNQNVADQEAISTATAAAASTDPTTLPMITQDISTATAEAAAANVTSPPPIKLEEEAPCFPYWKLAKPHTNGAGSTTMMAIKLEDVDDGDEGEEAEDGNEEDQGGEEVNCAQSSVWQRVARIKQEEAAENRNQEEAEQKKPPSYSERVARIEQESAAEVARVKREAAVEIAQVKQEAALENEDERVGEAHSAPSYAQGVAAVKSEEVTASGDSLEVPDIPDDQHDDDSVVEIVDDSDDDSPASHVHANGGRRAGDVIEILSSDDDDADVDQDPSCNNRPTKKTKVESKSHEIHRGRDAVELLKDVKLDKLEFLCYDEFREPREWRIMHKDEDLVCILSDAYVFKKLQRTRYNWMLQSSMSMNFFALQYTGRSEGEWQVVTNNAVDRALESDFVKKAFRPEFLASVMADPSKKHMIEPWCRVFPHKVLLPTTHRPDSEFLSALFTIRFPLVSPLKDWKLIFAFASAINYMTGLEDEAKAIHKDGASKPSDGKQIQRLQGLVANYLPKYSLNHSLENRTIHTNISTELAADVTPMIIRPQLARGSHVTCFLVIFKGHIFEPSFGRALNLHKRNLDLCCGAYVNSGEFLGVIECWKMVRSSRLRSK